MEVVTAVGRRQTAVARVYLDEGKGNITINKKSLEEYFTLPTLQYVVKQPLELLGVAGQYDIKVNLVGGGFNGQAEALRLHIRRAEPDRGISAAGAWHGTDTGSTGGHRMKEAGGISFGDSVKDFARKCKGKQGRARLAAAVGVLAMLLILLSELFPQNTAAGSTKNTKSAQSSTEYQAQLENRLEHLISQMSGAGKTTVMVTLETGEEAIYALDTQSGEMQSQQTHVLLEDGSALTETVCLPQVCGVAVLCEGGGDIRVAARITELVSALLDLPSNRICVEQRKG